MGPWSVFCASSGELGKLVYVQVFALKIELN